MCIIVKSFVCKKNLQAVKELYEIVPSLKWEKEEKRINKIVFIGNLIYFSSFNTILSEKGLLQLVNILLLLFLSE